LSLGPLCEIPFLGFHRIVAPGGGVAGDAGVAGVRCIFARF
jgi:hypothetical protein